MTAKDLSLKIQYFIPFLPLVGWCQHNPKKKKVLRPQINSNSRIEERDEGEKKEINALPLFFSITVWEKLLDVNKTLNNGKLNFCWR